MPEEAPNHPAHVALEGRWQTWFVTVCPGRLPPQSPGPHHPVPAPPGHWELSLQSPHPCRHVHTPQTPRVLRREALCGDDPAGALPAPWPGVSGELVPSTKFFLLAMPPARGGGQEGPRAQPCPGPSTKLSRICWRCQCPALAGSPALGDRSQSKLGPFLPSGPFFGNVMQSWLSAFICSAGTNTADWWPEPPSPRVVPVPWLVLALRAGHTRSSPQHFPAGHWAGCELHLQGASI